MLYILVYITRLHCVDLSFGRKNRADIRYLYAFCIAMWHTSSRDGGAKMSKNRFIFLPNEKSSTCNFDFRRNANGDNSFCTAR